MAAQTDIPLSFTTDDPVVLKRELERLASSLTGYFGGLTGQQHAAVVQRRLTNRRLNDTTAAFGQITPVSLANAAAVLRVSLPRADPRNAGLLLVIRRDTTLGTIYLSAPGCLVNGFAIVEVSAEIAATTLIFDGENYYAPPGSVWGG